MHIACMYSIQHSTRDWCSIWVNTYFEAGSTFSFQETTLRQAPILQHQQRARLVSDLSVSRYLEDQYHPRQTYMHPNSTNNRMNPKCSWCSHQKIFATEYVHNLSTLLLPFRVYYMLIDSTLPPAYKWIQKYIIFSDILK